MMHQGSCHCGKIAYDVDGDVSNVIECNCSHCSRKGYLLAFVPRGNLKLKTPEANLSTYTFNKHALKHHFCGTCGCAPFAFGTDPKGNAMAAVNVRCLPAVDLGTLTITKVDGKSF
ncbi:MAG: GFA family protein [Rhodospirillaceae bacterium]|nr:GFA family protein [Rhodospirillaceae bacterium]